MDGSSTGHVMNEQPEGTRQGSEDVLPASLLGGPRALPLISSARHGAQDRLFRRPGPAAFFAALAGRGRSRDCRHTSLDGASLPRLRCLSEPIAASTLDRRQVGDPVFWAACGLIRLAAPSDPRAQALHQVVLFDFTPGHGASRPRAKLFWNQHDVVPLNRSRSIGARHGDPALDLRDGVDPTKPDIRVRVLVDPEDLVRECRPDRIDAREVQHDVSETVAT